MGSMHSINPDKIGRYDVVRALGCGAMGRVFLARDPVLDRDVAIKLLRDDLGLLPEQRQQLLDRMRQEARASARLSHPNIVMLFDMGEEPGRGLFLVFEYVEGPTLKARILEGGLPRQELATLALELGCALAVAHRAGVVHRDIKPENVILSPAGAKIADFGIARVPESTLTRDGHILGTPAYSAPESILSGEFSPKSDQFSLAATLYEAISLTRAFPGDDAVAVASSITNSEAPPFAKSMDLTPEVDAVLARGMARDARRRFSDTEEFGRELCRVLSDREGEPAKPSVQKVDPSIVVGPRALRIAVGAGLVGALSAVLLVSAVQSCDRTRPRAPSPDGLGRASFVTPTATTQSSDRSAPH